MRFQLGRCARAPLLAPIAALAIACNRNDLAAPERAGAHARRAVSTAAAAMSDVPGAPDSIMEARFDLSKHDRRPEASDSELVAQVRAAAGRVAIGLRHPGTARSRVSGRYPAMHRSQLDQLVGLLGSRGVRVEHRFRGLTAVLATIDAADAIRIRDLPFVNYVHTLGGYQLAQSGQAVSWGQSLMNMPGVWNAGYDASAARVVVIDTGLDSLQANALGGEGFSVTPECLSMVTGVSCFETYNYYWGHSGHGTHVSGIIAAANDTGGVVGYARNLLSLTSIRVCRVVGNVGDCRDQEVIDALDWVATNGRSRQIINMSFGSDSDRTLMHEAVVRAANAGILMVASAGNLSQGYTNVTYPAAYSEVIAVSATLANDAFATNGSSCPEGGPGNAGSVSGDKVELSAPVSQVSLYFVSQGGQYAMCGTSMAAPVVAAVAAIIWTKYPSEGASSIRGRLQQGARDYGTPGRDAQFGYGRVEPAMSLYTTGYTASITGYQVVRQGSQCLYSAGTNMPDPVSHAWYVAGSLVGTEGTIRYTAVDGSFRFMYAVQDGGGGWAFAFHDVTVSGAASECVDY